MSAEEGLVSAAATTDHPSRRVQLRSNAATGAFWFLGSAVVAAAQPGIDRKLAAAGTAAVAIAVIVVVSVLTKDPHLRYFRTLVAGMIAVPVSSTWLLEHLIGKLQPFEIAGLETRIGLPLMVVLFAPPLVQALPDNFRPPRALWQSRSILLHQARSMDWIMLAYAALVVPGLALGIAHHASKTNMAQDLGLVVFFVFMYVAGRLVTPEAARASAGELVGVLLLLALANTLLLGGVTPPLYTFLGAACAAAIGYLVLRPRTVNLLPVGLAVVLLASQAVAIRNGVGTTTAVELSGALGIVFYLAVRMRHLVPQWLVVALTAAALVGFVGFTSDGQTLQGRYRGPDPSNTGRTFEAQQVRSEIRHSPLSLALGRGFGGTINETGSSVVFQQTLLGGGRDLAHVQEVHLLDYEFLLKNGLLGFAWLGVFVLGLAVLGIRALEMASSERDPTLVVYAALPFLGLAVAFAAATHLQVNPLNGLSVGVLSTLLARKRSPVLAHKRSPVLRPAFALPAAAVVCVIAGAVFFTRPFVMPSLATAPSPPSIPLPKGAAVGDLELSFPLHFYQRHFSTSNPAITGVHGVRVHGVVVASYPLLASAEWGASGARLNQFGVLFELYRTPRLQPGDLARPVTFPLSIYDFQGGRLFFKVNGQYYGAIAWADTQAPERRRQALYALIDSIHVK